VASSPVGEIDKEAGFVLPNLFYVSDCDIVLSEEVILVLVVPEERQ